MPSAHLDRAAEVAVTSRNQNNGQSCIAAKRFFVHRDVAEEFTRLFAAKIADLTVGDPMDEDTQVGPLATESGLEDVDRYVQDAVGKGATVLAGGKRADRPGWFRAHPCCPASRRRWTSTPRRSSARSPRCSSSTPSTRRSRSRTATPTAWAATCGARTTTSARSSSATSSPGYALASYTRTMNWAAATMTESFDRKPGAQPRVVEIRRRLDSTARCSNSRQTFVVSGRHAWHVDGPRRAGGRHSRSGGDLPARQVAQPARFPQGGRLPGANPRATWRWELGEMGRDGPEVKPARVHVVSITVNGKYRVDATINQETHAAADSHLGSPPGARRHELRARVHQRQLRRPRQRNQVSHRLAFASGLGRQLRRAERERRPQRVRRHVAGRARQSVRGSADRAGGGPAGVLRRARRAAEAGGRACT